MASGYVTSDGKDLDARYLGINAKANSAKTADTATKATTADVAAAVNKEVKRKGDWIVVNITLKSNVPQTYTVPVSGIAVFSTASDRYEVKLNGAAIPTEIRSAYATPMFLNKGDTLWYKQTNADRTYARIAIYEVGLA